MTTTSLAYYYFYFLISPAIDWCSLLPTRFFSRLMFSCLDPTTVLLYSALFMSCYQFGLFALLYSPRLGRCLTIVYNNYGPNVYHVP